MSIQSDPIIFIASSKTTHALEAASDRHETIPTIRMEEKNLWWAILQSQKIGARSIFFQRQRSIIFLGSTLEYILMILCFFEVKMSQFDFLSVGENLIFKWDEFNCLRIKRSWVRIQLPQIQVCFRLTIFSIWRNTSFYHRFSNNTL